MAAAPQNGGMVFRGKSGRKYYISVYWSDVAAAYSRFSLSGAAGASSQDYWVTPEDVVLEDYSVKTGLTDTTVASTEVNGTPIGLVVVQSNHVNTLAFRPQNILAVGGGRQLQFKQG